MSNIIHGRCHTNLDEWRGAKWPTKFVALPRVGDYVRGEQGDYRPWLRVVTVTHEWHNGEPTVLVDLHK